MFEMINGTATLIEEQHNYPFGMELAGPAFVGGGNPYRYTGKEWETDLDLGMYDFGARWYDPAAGRWWGVDALAEDFYGWSPFNYTLGNPLRFIDPDGNTVWVSTGDGQRLKYGNQQLFREDGSVYEGDDEFARRAQSDLNKAMKNDEYAKVYGRLDESDVDYVIRFQGEDGPTGTLQTDGESVFINYTDPKESSVSYGEDAVGYLAAETEHARQFEDGELGFVKMMSEWKPDHTYDMIDERKSHIFAVGVSGGSQKLLEKEHGTIEKSLKTFSRYGAYYKVPINNWKDAGKPINGINHGISQTGRAETVKHPIYFHRRRSP